MSTKARTLWIQADAAKLTLPILDRRGDRLQIAKGTSVVLNFGLFEAGALDDISDVVEFTIEVKPLRSTESSASLLQKIVGIGSCNPTLTLDQWKGLSAQHVSVSFSDGETNNASGEVLLCVWGVATGGLKKTWFSQKVEFIEDGCGTTTTAPTPVDSFYTADEIDALLVSLVVGSTLANLPTITGLTGGGSTNLDGLATVTIPVGKMVLLSFGDVLQIWILRASTDTEDLSATPARVRPDDFNASTNAKVWKQIG